jgi:hypothetical protein
MADKKCFIIAPISTLEDRVPLYLNDINHCEHVLDHLLIPAAREAGFEPVKPKSKGANLIHAEIVQNLQTAALVLCDMSGLNPNVFFELGIRTAMKMPICLTIDKATKNPPFDLSLVNHHAYDSDLRPWILPGEVEKLSTHIRESATTKDNELWKYFALRFVADSTDSKPKEGNELSLLRMEFEALRKDLRSTRHRPMDATLSRSIEGKKTAEELDRERRAEVQIYVIARDLGLTPRQVQVDGSIGRVIVDHIGGNADVIAEDQLVTRVRKLLGVQLQVVRDLN